MESTIVFVYNADRGLFNTLTDTAHKILSPETYQCNLCYITYSALGMRKEWKEFLDTIDTQIEFLHRDELREKYGIDNISLPAVFIKKNELLEIAIVAEAINSCKSLADLKELLQNQMLNKL